MSVSDADIAFATELFSGLGHLTTRRMMGGLCVYCDGTIFALLRSDGQILLKGTGDLIPALEAAGATRWTYTREGRKTAAMPYWTLPEDALDDPELARDWARRALALL